MTDLAKNLAKDLATGLPTNLSSVPRYVSGLESFDSANRLGSAVTEGLQGSTSGFWGRLLISSAAVPGTEFYFRCFSATGTGMRFFALSGVLTATMSCAGATTCSAPTKTFDAAMRDKLIELTWWYDTTSLHMAYQGAEIGAGTVAPGAYVPNVSQSMTLGVAVDGTLPTTGRVHACEGGDGFVPTAGEVLAAHAATRARIAAGLSPFAGIAGKTTHRWQVGSAWDPPTTLADEVGAHTLSMLAGSASGLTRTSLLAQWAT